MKRKVGRPSKPGDTLHIPLELLEIVKALKRGDRVAATELFADWLVWQKNLEERVDDSN